ncbi:myelin-associated glycoprotein-like [Anabas testudineus]|uniref:myelin-associated glycoprotein-like n=1 Tax=Anabas testudineus TaxID=64144 RepID=UPI000E45DC55|nr:myelin-associated glycoprotein-like [Anabas testudineus]
MGAFKWPLFFVFLWFKVVQTEASTWTATVPSSVQGIDGSCVVIPCSYNYPEPGKQITGYTGIWYTKADDVIYHKDNNQIKQEYKGRTELVGDITQKNCSLKIDPLRQSDRGPFYFRIELGGYDQYSYRNNEVSITVISAPQPTVSVKEEVVEGQTVSASCSVSHSCPSSPPEFTWTHSGEKRFQSQQLTDGQWKATSVLTFKATKDDHNKPLSCTVRYKGGLEREQASNVLKVKYAPVNVKVDYKSHVKEGETVQLKCSSEANPPANSYLWHNEEGAQLHQGQSYKLINVSRHTGVLNCTAINTVGESKSSPVQLNVSFAPEIKKMSCSSEDDVVKCVCIVESSPPSMVHFVFSDRVLSSNKTETRGFNTTETLHTKSGSSEFVQCLAINTLGKVSLTLPLAVNGKMPNLYIFIAIGAGTGLVILLIVLGVVRKRRCGDLPTSYDSVTKTAETVKFQKQMDDEDIHDPDEHVYINIETDCDEAIYVNV